MLSAVANYFNDQTGLEKALRLIQCFSQTAAGLSQSATDAALWNQARSMMIVPRRFLRITKWIDAWQMAGRQFQASGEDNIRMLLTVIKLSCLGMYMFLEMFTITDAMKVTNTTWGPTVLLESLKFWFYALAASILLSLYEMWILPTAPSETDKSVNGKATTGEKNSSTTSAVEKTNAKASTGAPKLATKSMLCKKLIMDCCDILIPGSAVGWINIDPVTVGSTGCVSTLLAMGDVWSRVNPTVVKAA